MDTFWKPKECTGPRIMTLTSPSTCCNDRTDLSFALPTDCLVIDRGFRDVVEDFEDLGFNTRKPPFLHGTGQFSTAEANEARLITSIRWPVESMNGRIKNKYKLFDHVISNHHLIDDRIDGYYRIACALLNAFHVPVRTEKPEDLATANFMLQRAMAGNNLRERINEMGLSWWTSRGHAAGWKKYAHGMVMSFPRMTTDDLRQITIGIYQIKNAAS